MEMESQTAINLDNEDVFFFSYGSHYHYYIGDFFVNDSQSDSLAYG